MSEFRNDMITDLIINNKLNKDLLNDVNKLMISDKSYFKLKDMQRERSKYYYEDYNNRELNENDKAGFILFLLCSLVNPLEYLKGIESDASKIEGILKNTNKELYEKLLRNIRQYKFLKHDYVSLKYQDDAYEVFSFIDHLRNSLSRAGNGWIQFYPNNESIRDISHIYFYDERPQYNRYYDPLDNNSYKIFFVKLDIEAELLPLINDFTKLVLELAKVNENDYTKEDIKNRLSTLAHKEINI